MLEETKRIAESAKEQAKEEPHHDQRNNNFGRNQNINAESSTSGPRRVLEAKRLGGKKKEGGGTASAAPIYDKNPTGTDKVSYLFTFFSVKSFSRKKHVCFT